MHALKKQVFALGGGKRTACAQSPAPGSGLTLWCRAHRCSLLGCNTSTKKVQLAGSTARTVPLNVASCAEWHAGRGSPHPPRAACRSELLPKKHQVSLEQKCPFPRQGLHGQGTGPPHGVSHSRSRSSAARWEGEGKYPKGPRAKTPKEHWGQPQPSLPFCKAGEPGSAPNCTQSHPRYGPRQQIGFIVDDSSWNRNISPTSHSLFTKSH